MQITLATIAAAVSILGLAFANLSPQSGPRGARWQALISVGLHHLAAFTAFWIVVLFLFTVPSSRPFAPGLSLGWGFLIGAILGLYAIFEAAGNMEGDGWVARSVGLLSAACLGPSLILLIFRGYPNEALMGCAFGAVLVAAIWSSILRLLYAERTTEKRDTLSCYRGVEIFAVATVVVAAGARLGIDHFPRSAPAALGGGYWVLPALLLAASALAVIVLSSDRQDRLRRWLILADGLVAAAIAVVLTAVLQVKLLPELAWEVPLYGLLAFGFLLSVLIQAESTTESDQAPRPTVLAFGALLIALTLAAVAFKRLHGYGEALALVAALPIVAVAYLGRERSREPVAESLALGGLTMVVLLMLYRVFLEKAGRGWALDFQQHYDYLAVILGSSACFGLLAFTMQGMERVIGAIGAGAIRLRALMARTALLGLLVAVVPLALAAVWGVKAVGGFLAGLVVAEAIWMMLSAWVVGKERGQVLAAAPHIYFIGTALVAIQFSPLVLALELTRAHKLIIVAIITVAAIIWVLADAFRHPRPQEGE